MTKKVDWPNREHQMYKCHEPYNSCRLVNPILHCPPPINEAFIPFCVIFHQGHQRRDHQNDWTANLPVKMWHFFYDWRSKLIDRRLTEAGWKVTEQTHLSQLLNVEVLAFVLRVISRWQQPSNHFRIFHRIHETRPLSSKLLSFIYPIKNGCLSRPHIKPIKNNFTYQKQ